MTTAAHQRSSQPPGNAPALAPQPVAPLALVPPGRDWRCWAIAMLALVVMYGLLYNGYWVPGGDSELYISVARSIARGEGCRFNGQPSNISPPGWALVLAGAMKITPSFAFLKLLTAGSMVGFLGISYWILRRFASPAMSLLMVLTAGIISHVYPLTFWLHSDAFFSVLAAGALLLAMQINENRRGAWGAAWRIALLAALCVAGVFVRWVGLLQWGLVAAALLPALRRQDRQLPDWHKQVLTTLLALALSGGLTAAAYLGLRWHMKLTPQQITDVREAGGTDAPLTVESRQPEVLGPKLNRNYTWVQEYCQRILHAGQWFSWFCWHPVRAGGPLLDRAGTLVGWVIIVLLSLRAVRGAQRQQWLWPALAGYCFLLCILWPNPNARYFVPIAPLLLLGIVLGGRDLAAMARRAWLRRLLGAGVAVFLGSVVLCNGALYALEVWVARSDHFPDVYEAGLNKPLVSAAAWLREHGVQDREVAVSEKYVNNGRIRYTLFGPRAAVMLSDRIILRVPRRYIPPERFPYWGAPRGVKYYLYQAPIVPPRVWHFRLPATQPSDLAESGWQLYEVRGNTLVRVEVPEVLNWPTRVPGID